MTSLSAGLPKGFQHTFTVRRYGRYYGIPTSCPFCDVPIPEDNKTTAQRRRWQVAHMAMTHVKVRVLHPKEE